MNHKLRDRPEKRVGGGGLGKYKTMNKDNQKARKFKQINSRDVKKYTR